MFRWRAAVCDCHPDSASTGLSNTPIASILTEVEIWWRRVYYSPKKDGC